jgi:ADP-ribosyl-[dinitrogen reductase] hydrolase
MTPGSCLCGAVRYEVDDSNGDLGHCHCRMCQKFHGAPFGTYLEVPRERFRVVAGQSFLTRYRSSPQVSRLFCSRCGSPMLFQKAGNDTVDVIAATLDEAPEARLTYEIWTSAKTAWLEAEAALESHPKEPED